MQVTCCDEYLQWLQSMYALFGTKWSKLYCGPMLCIESKEQGSRISCNGAFNPLMVGIYSGCTKQNVLLCLCTLTG